MSDAEFDLAALAAGIKLAPHVPCQTTLSVGTRLAHVGNFLENGRAIDNRISGRLQKLHQRVTLLQAIRAHNQDQLLVAFKFRKQVQQQVAAPTGA